MLDSRLFETIEDLTRMRGLGSAGVKRWGLFPTLLC
jgi:hypothetical protein